MRNNIIEAKLNSLGSHICLKTLPKEKQDIILKETMKSLVDFIDDKDSLDVINENSNSELSECGYEVEIGNPIYNKKSGDIIGDHHWFMAMSSCRHPEKTFELARLLSTIWDLTVGRPNHWYYRSFCTTNKTTRRELFR